MTLELDGVTYAYDQPVVEDLSLSVDQNEVLAVIGPSGVGKTTLLRLAALFTEPDAGSVRLDGTDVWSVGNGDRLALRRRVGTVFQSPSLFDATVARNVAYGRRVRRPWRRRLRETVRSLVGSTEPDDEVVRALATVGMEDALDARATSLSGGEAQRVSFARAVAYDPDLLLLDEPTSDLDPRNTAVIEEAIGAARDRGMGVVLATHDMHQARRVADRVAVLLGTGVTEVGPTSTVFEDPADERTAKFISGELVY